MTRSTMIIPNTCYYFDTHSLCNPGLYEEGLSLLPWQERREKIAGYRFEDNKRLCLGSGLLLCYALKQANIRDTRLTCGEFGKPALFSPPEGGFHFNSSHSGAIAACAVSSFPVGVDVEQLKPRDPKIARRVFTPNEQAWLWEGDFQQRFFTLWTRKESCLKMLGTGFHRPPNSIEVLKECGEDFTFSHHSLEDYQLTVCSSVPGCSFQELTVEALLDGCR